MVLSEKMSGDTKKDPIRSIKKNVLFMICNTEHLLLIKTTKRYLGILARIRLPHGTLKSLLMAASFRI